MKQCPECNCTYADETLTFCLADGALLSAPYDPAATLVLPSPNNLSPTVEGLPRGQSKPTLTKQNRNISSSHIIIFVMAILLLGSTVALFYKKGKENSNFDAKSMEPPTPASNPIKSEQVSANSPSPIVQQDKNSSRFSVTSCNSIRDSQTGLEWFVGLDRNMTWYEAQQWTVGLGVCGGGWRMPSIEEIRTLYNPALKAGIGYFTGGKYFPAHIDPVFDAIGGGSWVWSNERVGDDARSLNLNQGKSVTFSATNTFYSTRAFAARTIRE